MTHPYNPTCKMEGHIGELNNEVLAISCLYLLVASYVPEHAHSLIIIMT